MKSGQYLIKGLVAAAAIVGADQYSKWLIVEQKLRQVEEPLDFPAWFLTRRPATDIEAMAQTYQQIEITSFFNLTMVWNKGVSFGLLNNLGDYGPLILIAVALLASMLMLVWLALTPRPLLATALSLIVGGAIGNVIDRVRFGAVADFFDLHYAGWHWPAFNIADSCIVIGAGFLLLDAFLRPKTEPAQPASVA
jgi:signal peptidase II